MAPLNQSSQVPQSPKEYRQTKPLSSNLDFEVRSLDTMGMNESQLTHPAWHLLKAKSLSYLGRYRESLKEYATLGDEVLWERLVVALAAEQREDVYVALGKLGGESHRQTRQHQEVQRLVGAHRKVRDPDQFDQGPHLQSQSWMTRQNPDQGPCHDRARDHELAHGKNIQAQEGQ